MGKKIQYTVGPKDKSTQLAALKDGHVFTNVGDAGVLSTKKASIRLLEVLQTITGCASYLVSGSGK